MLTKKKKMKHLSGFKSVTLNRGNSLLLNAALYHQSYRATYNEQLLIVSFVLNHLVWNFKFTQYLRPSAFSKIKALGCFFKQ